MLTTFIIKRTIIFINNRPLYRQAFRINNLSFYLYIHINIIMSTTGNTIIWNRIHHLNNFNDLKTIIFTYTIRFFIISTLRKNHIAGIFTFMNNLVDIAHIQFGNRHSRSNHRLARLRFTVR